MSERRRMLGRLGEDIALERLRRGGARLVARNARTRFGEIDLIVVERGALAFVEVKTLGPGSSAGPVTPLESIGPAKRRRLRRLAAAWLDENRERPGASSLRFDAIGIRLDSAGRLTTYEHVRDAF